MDSDKQEVICDDTFYNFKCPHCLMCIIVNKKELNCKIFRCGVYRSNYKQIPPHLPKDECDKLRESDAIYGCGKPFLFIDSDKNKYVEKCGYI